ncbi:pyruvate dehydrogenase complex dihydrolipoamide acetyltransferase [Rhodopseudomonas palustris]|uniref:Acetyltransferase component of pyruvate dehydrogenase complex n=1 Tax=Rhodopseudomonas palustris (strain ATCC BAA-98 / CGA009) TaxID=258594 RepID=Q6N5V6_RHOPA|nr:pyruvate dehydrogenase complex dihydrolipoamide acetyltransferase [Rhodopseudomonas palustris]OPF89914.1 pyruvate dehydrogenase complex dihydrolipoamide acetyltransferase [Rhodopseudomonas palustris]PPQ45429.1 pyruvate dehydrogenase complex dihydrolipoamide acetyltransferase [Rhodopseudomonas palustris]QQM04396.1 Dihydrolipoyllysine-residue acetyltransferase component of pyruvate dehydrogenase complex [Rhodopseudomonas palustris]WAB75784.1 pyruvate dehydrogenase complex dihydrolipoamide acet
MPINILMPALSPTMEKGNLAKWLKKEGDKVKSGDVIAEIETDKATMEVEAADEGTLAKIIVPEGTQDVPVNDVIAVLAADGEDVKAAGAGWKASAGGAPSPQRGEGAGPSGGKAEANSHIQDKADQRPTPQPPSPLPNGERSLPQAAGEGAPAPANGRVFASPLARRLAKDAGIDIARVTGTGPHGRVIARDVEQAKSGGGLKAPASAPAGPAIAAAMSDQQIRALYPEGSYEVVPHDGMRRTIAQRLTQSTQTIPHFYLTIDCNLDRLLAAREDINAAAPKDKDGKPAYKLSVNDFIIKAMAIALQRIPDANVSWTEGGMLKHKHSDIGVAVAMPGGLITPIIRSAETQSLSSISAQMKDFAARARARKLKPEEYQGGTTAVSNLGMFGIKDFTAVINPPHATILAVGTGEQRAIVKDGKIEVATMMSVTLSCDHRAVDGALGAELIGAFKTLIENPVMMMV